MRKPWGYRKNLVGQKFNKLTVLKYSHTKNNVSWWLCICDCGNTKSTARPYLILGDTKSCGCDNKGLNRQEKNGMWKGDKVKYGSLHAYIKYYLKKPEKCSNCNTANKKLDLANISQEYKRDFDDWEWLCRRCHMTKDGRINNLLGYQRGKEYVQL